MAVYDMLPNLPIGAVPQNTTKGSAPAHSLAQKVKRKRAGALPCSENMKKMISARMAEMKQQCESHKAGITELHPTRILYINTYPYNAENSALPLCAANYPEKNVEGVPPHMTPETEVFVKDRDVRYLEELTRLNVAMLSAQETLLENLYSNISSGEDDEGASESIAEGLIKIHHDASKVAVESLAQLTAVRRRSILTKATKLSEEQKSDLMAESVLEKQSLL